MVPTDDDRGGDSALTHELVEGEPRLRPFAEAEPADPRGQALEHHALLRCADPTPQPIVVGEEVEDGLVSAGDVLRVTREGHPTERPAARAELRPDELGHESRDGEGILDAGGLGL